MTGAATTGSAETTGRVRVYVATTNAGKLAEMRALFRGSPFSPVAYPAYDDPVEGETSYADNAALKARALHAQLARTGLAEHVLADDSGLEVAALGGRPGVLTAYYGGVDLGWSERRAALLAELAALDARQSAGGDVDRRARFVCALHFVSAGGQELATMATVDGEIATAERGERGFSFDPVFRYPPADRTFAEMSAIEKDRVSHRAVAVAALIAALERAGLG